MAQPLWKIVIHTHTHKIVLLYDPAITLLDIYSKEIKSLSCRNFCSPLATLFTTVKT